MTIPHLITNLFHLGDSPATGKLLLSVFISDFDRVLTTTKCIAMAAIGDRILENLPFGHKQFLRKLE